MEHKFGAVALMGPPNAGKSTLLNHLVGEKVAIVTPKPQTTRNRISGIMSLDTAQVVFLDTPGVHREKGRMNRFMLQCAWQAMSEADLVAIMVDAAYFAAKPQAYEKELEPLVEPTRDLGSRVVCLVNKVDKVRDKTRLLVVLQRMAEVWPEAEIFPLCALNGEGVDVFVSNILARLPEGPPMFPDDQISTVPLRFMAAEAVREKLFMELKQELPYQTTVEIESWEEEGNLLRVAALIYVARRSHKGMVIGKGGERLKRIGAAVRAELEELTGMKVYLQLWVKVRENWTEDAGFLRSLGFGE